MADGRRGRGTRHGGGTGRREALTLLGSGILAGLGAAHTVPTQAIASAGGVPQVYGLATYRVLPDGTLDGIWTIPAYEGRIGTERATGGPGGGPAGHYGVEIYNPDGELDLQGTLEVAAQGSAWRLTWLDVGGDRYEGVGLTQADGGLAVMYWGPV